MAVVKANYVKRGKGDRGRAKATIRYITHRKGRDGERVTRKLFGFDGTLSKAQVYRMIDEAKKGTIFYRFVLSPDPRREDRYRDLSLKDLTTDTIIKLEERLGREVQFAAAIHDDHSNHRHTHVMVLVKGGRLTREDFKALRIEATEQALFQRRMRDLARPLHLQQSARLGAHAVRAHARVKAQSATAGYTPRHSERAYSPTFKPLTSYSCPICRFHQALASTNRIFASAHRCPYCGVKMKRDREFASALSLRTGREAGYT